MSPALLSPHRRSVGGAAADAGRECRHAQLIVESREYRVTVVGGIILGRLKEDLVLASSYILLAN